ncbi:EAL domain-containing protein [Pseudomonas sp. S75]|uniref:EAL domain-containing protein n=1 Tax=unclassified Pseudomonas TaxID=196821 RepID=UPI001907F031|nr:MULTISPECIES: EAL domain-containing protein [unclassified Pseudomonas]MBJ9976664.1 EAL domain-containing protein [Pseudomonas sp. S30]MBK0153666.1 EAL domain-containing protein [Pseudomonas sp. S75]
MTRAFIRDSSREHRSRSSLPRDFTSSAPLAYAQPQINLRSLELEGFEILARWAHPQHGLLHPAQVLPHIGFIQHLNALTEALLRQTLAHMASYQPPVADCRVGLNVALGQLTDDAFVERLCQLCDQRTSGLSLVLEITEQASIASERTPGAAQRALQRLTGCGWLISLDDFGTGTSTYERLCTLPVSEIKIERHFIEKLGAPNAREEIIVQHLARLAAELGVDCVAEGIERREQLLTVQALGCSRGQGYLFSPPMALQSLHSWCAGWQTARCRTQFLEQLRQGAEFTDGASRS